MNEFSRKRIKKLNQVDLNQSGEYVLYWMQAFRRVESNFALEYAVELANELNKPLLVYEGLSASYPWASERFHTYILEGMFEHVTQSAVEQWNYFGYAERTPKAGKGLVYALAEKACVVVTDDYPVFIMQKHNAIVSQKINTAYFVVDSNGLIPLSVTEKAPYTAYLFRKIMQKNFVKAVQSVPVQKPLELLKNRTKIQLSDDFLSKYPPISTTIQSIEEFVHSLSIDHSVKPIAEKGTRAAALKQYEHFLQNKLKKYDSDRNHPDKSGASNMSGYLHFGKVSQHELVLKALAHQNSEWNLERIVYENGQSGNFFKGNSAIESFLDELITWREVGFHFAHHNPKYDEFDSLPDWALQTLAEHEADKREFIYSLEQFEQAKTHDRLWNAAQRELVRTGRIHNYLRMVWGKKILEWTPNPRVALQIMIELNNKYAIDGRDPNSYSGIFWVLGRFDRAWGERNVFGKIRYMSSEMTAKKVDLKEYLKKFG